MYAGEHVIESKRIVRAETKQTTHRRVGPDTAICQITRPQPQLAGVGGKFHQLLALSQLAFNLAPTPALQKQIDNHRALIVDNEDRADNVPTVLLPHRGLPESNYTIRRETAFTDAPAFQGPPIEHRYRVGANFER